MTHEQIERAEKVRERFLGIIDRAMCGLCRDWQKMSEQQRRVAIALLVEHRE